MAETSWVQAGNYPTVVAAQVARANLELAGIPAQVFDGETGGIGIYNLAIGGIRLMVRAEDLEASREILASDLSSDAITVSDEEDITGTSLYCSRCHSRDLETLPLDVPRGLSGLARLWHKWFARKLLRRCRACGNAWRE